MTFEHLFATLWKRRLLFTVVGALLVAAVVVVTLELPKSYRATSTLFVGVTDQEALAFGPNVGEQRARTYARLASNPNVAEETAERLPPGAPVFPSGLDREEVTDRVSVAPVERTELLEITAAADEPREAQLLANLYADVVVARTERDLSSGDASSQISVGEYAGRPRNPAKPDPPLYIGVGTVLALLLAFGVVLLRERVDDRIPLGEVDTELLGHPVIARVPVLRGKRAMASPDVIDDFRLLKANLDLSVGNRIRVLGITSGSSSEGKSTTCANFAMMAVADAERVVIVEGDLRRPGLSGTVLGDHGLSSTPGLSGYLAGECGKDDIIFAHPDIWGLDVIWAGQVKPHPTVLLRSSRMVALIDHLRTQYDRVLLDTSPISVGADATLALSYVDGTLYVIDAKTKLSHVRAGLRQTEKTRPPVLGVILNRAKSRTPRDYGYYAAAAPPPQAVETARGAEGGWE
jgi:receptor protein-tyrosine kinase